MTFSILSLDGGGMWALIEVRALIEMFGASTTGHQVLGRFDLVAGNSAGSIVLAGLLENKALSDILALFQTESVRRSLFSPTTSFGDKSLQFLSGVGPKYSTVAKLPALERQLPVTGDQQLAQVAAGVPGASGKPIHVLIVGFDYDRNRASFFRSAPVNNGFGYGDVSNVTLAGAVHASTNAPINYFDAPAQVPGVTDVYWDGGITGNNNPSLAACVEAATLGYAPTNLRVLSLGTGSVVLPLADSGAPASPFYASRGNSSLVADLGKLATSILDDPPDFATFAVHMMTGAGADLPPGAPSRIVRVNPLVSPTRVGGVWGAPQGWTASQFQYLCNLGMDALADSDVQYISEWCDLWIAGGAPNQPIRMDGDSLQAEIGAALFSEAVDCWRQLTGFVPADPALLADYGAPN